MLRLKRLVLLLLVIGLSGFAICGCKGDKGELATNNRLAGSYRSENSGWIFVHAEGSPDQLGYQHGYLLASEIDDLLRVVRPLLKHKTNREWDFYRKAGQDMLWPKVDEEYQQEID